MSQAHTTAKIQNAKALREVVILDGQSFFFGPGIPESDVIAVELAGAGFHTLSLPDGREGLCWNER